MLPLSVKKLLQRTGGACIIVEDDQPRYVILDFAQYERLLEDNKGLQKIEHEEMLERVNRDIEAWHEQEQVEQNEAEPLAQELEQVKVEDLPF